MIWNYYLIAIRNPLYHNVFSLISLAGCSSLPGKQTFRVAPVYTKDSTMEMLGEILIF
ncbi:MAG TPA: hypothetical protein VFW11_04085 [Cyclobacteriaceae bacterium]|nr:hypothetical protein [Cyclobacteriaceae bacterium]